MFVVKNAWKSVTRNKGRNMLIIVIVTIIAALRRRALRPARRHNRPIHPAGGRHRKKQRIR